MEIVYSEDGKSGTLFPNKKNNEKYFTGIRYKDEEFVDSDFHHKYTNIQEIIKRNYDATVRRGQIKKNSNCYDFINKIKEETGELMDSAYGCGKHFDPKELADITLVCFTMAIYYEIDLIEIMEKKMLFNEKRED